MSNEKLNEQDVIALTREMFHAYYSGNMEPWFSRLCKQSVWIGHSEPALFGDVAIRERFRKMEGHVLNVLKEEIFQVQIKDNTALVCGRYVTGEPDGSFESQVYFTMCYWMAGEELKLMHQHMSHDFIKIEGKNTEVVSVDDATMQFIKKLLLDRQDRQEVKKIALPSGRQCMFVDIDSIIYIQSQGRNTEVYCVDRTITCNTSIGELSEQLPDKFYMVHRGYIVNTIYVNSIKRYELGLFFGITIPIPAQKYMQVKEEIKHQMLT